MSAIAKEAGTGMGTIYKYYPNKEILINNIYIKIKKEEKSVFNDFNSQESIKLQFENYFSSIIEFFIQNPTYFQFMEQLHASPIITEESKNEGNNSIIPISELLVIAKKQQIIKNIEIDELLMFIGGAVLSYLRWYFNQSKTKQIPLNNQIKLVWDAIEK